MIEQMGKSVYIKEVDPYGRALEWRYHNGEYTKIASVSLISGLNPQAIRCSQTAFACAFWRSWKEEHGL